MQGYVLNTVVILQWSINYFFIIEYFPSLLLFIINIDRKININQLNMKILRFASERRQKSNDSLDGKRHISYRVLTLANIINKLEHFKLFNYTFIQLNLYYFCSSECEYCKHLLIVARQKFKSRMKFQLPLSGVYILMKLMHKICISFPEWMKFEMR